jgi:hypothetical protein
MNVTTVGSLTIREDMLDMVKNLKEKPAAIAPIIKLHALNIQANAAKDAPVDTGALKNSLHAQAIDPENWIVEDGVEYGIYQELGTSKGVSAKHFLGGATEREAESFFEDIRKVLEKK